MDKESVNLHYVNLILLYLRSNEQGGCTPIERWGASTVKENADVVIDAYALGHDPKFDFDEFYDAASFVDSNIETLLGEKY